MSVKTLSSLRSWQLKQICFLMGAPVTGTKKELEATIRRCIKTPLLPRNGGRILSIDMGIRNLAYAVLDVSNEGSLLTQRLKVQHWRKLDVIDHAKKLPPAGIVPESTDEAMVKSDAADKLDANTAFTPSYLSKTAYDLATELLGRQPNTILIERQRFRSGGGANILEWTVRVNMLESMLWACFETLRRSQKSAMSAFPSIFEVSPKRVAPFWEQMEHTLPHGDLFKLSYTAGRLPSSSHTKIDKKRRMRYLCDMLNYAEADQVSLDFADDKVKEIAELMSDRNTISLQQPGHMKHSRAVRNTSPGKLDDLTDCMLQGITWVRWEENRRLMASMVKELEQK